MTVNTSAQAYADIKPKAPAIRDQVYDLIGRSSGISRTQIAQQLDLNEITVGSRITELLQSGKVHRKGQTVLSTSGKPEHLYVLGDGRPQIVKKPNTTLNQARLTALLNILGVSQETLITSFDWTVTPEGRPFWNQVFNNLTEKF